MMAKNKRPLSVTAAAIMFTISFFVLGYFSVEMTRSDAAMELRSAQRDEVDLTLTLEILSFDMPDRAIIVSNYDGSIRWSSRQAKVFWGMKVGDSIHKAIPFDQKEQHSKDFDHGVELSRHYHREHGDNGVRVVHTIECEALNSAGNLTKARVKIFSIPTSFIVLIDRL